MTSTHRLIFNLKQPRVNWYCFGSEQPDRCVWFTVFWSTDDFTSCRLNNCWLCACMRYGMMNHRLHLQMCYLQADSRKQNYYLASSVMYSSIWGSICSLMVQLSVYMSLMTSPRAKCLVPFYSQYLNQFIHHHGLIFSVYPWHQTLSLNLSSVICSIRVTLNALKKGTINLESYLQTLTP